MKNQQREKHPRKTSIPQISSIVDSPIVTIKSQKSIGFSDAKFTDTCRNKDKSIIKSGIDNKYLNPIHYLSTCEFTKRRNILYRLYCTSIRDYYAEFNLLSEKCTQKNTPRIQKQEKFAFITEVKSFIHQFFTIFKEVSTVQIAFFESLKDDIARREQILEWNTNELIQKLQSYKQSQTQFQSRSKIHKEEMQGIYSKYENLKKDQKDPYAYFNRKISQKKATQLSQSLIKQQRIRQTLLKDLNQVYDNSSQFQNNLVLYRQHLFNNKYKIMKKLTQISKSSRNSLTEFMVYLFQSVSRKNQEFNKLVKKSHDPMSRKKTRSPSHMDDILAVESYLIEVTNQYTRTIEEIQTVIRNLNDIFEELRKFTTNQIETKRKILELMNSVYDVDENPDNQVSKTLNFYQDFCTKIFEINNGINIAANQLTKLKKEAIKMSQITLSLVRNSTKTSSKSIDQTHNEASHSSQIQILLQKLSYDYPVAVIHNIYKDFQKNLTYLKNDASQRFHMKKKRVADSMEISHLEDDTVVKPKKRICKKEIWLWEKWQNEYDFKIDEFKVSSLSQIKQFANKFILEISQGKQIDRYSCSLEVKGEPAGFLIITDKQIKFETSQGSCILMMLLQEVEDVKIAVKMFGKIIVVNTVNGAVCFRGCIDVQKVFQSIQEVKSNSGAPVMKPPRQTVEVTVQQLAFMEERKLKIKPQLPKLEDYIFVEQLTIEDISIDHVFELIYSDKQCRFRGKVEPNFFAFPMKRGGASNYEVTKYDSIGPKFYTHEEGVTFLNCPVFSTRSLDYDVQLPPIPFFPKYAHNKAQCKLFWVSNEEFYYFIHNNTSGAPKSQTFFVQIYHKVEKIPQKSTKVSIYWRLVFLEDSFLKSKIIENATIETKNGTKIVFQDIKKYCTQAVCSGSGDRKVSQELLAEEEQHDIQQGKPSSGQGLLSQLIQKLKNAFKPTNSQTKGDQQQKGTSKIQSKGTNMLLIILTVVLLLNLLVHLFKTEK